MNSSYKITLLVTIVICGLILGYYITQDDQNQPPRVDDGNANVALNDSQDNTRPTLRGSDASTGTGTNTASSNNPSNTTPPPAANSGSSSGNSGSLLDRVNARAQGSNDPIAPPPAAGIPAASGNTSSNNTGRDLSTTPVTSDARSINPSQNSPAPSARTTAPTGNNNTQTSGNTSRPPDTGRAALVTTTPTTGRTYTIKAGDTLSSIAQQTLGSTSQWSAIAEANPFLDPRRLKVGQVIRLPDPDTESASGTTSRSTAAGPLEYVVRDGDSLTRIARMHYSDPNLWEVIYRANKAVIGKDPAGIRAGMKLFIPPDPTAAQ